MRLRRRQIPTAKPFQLSFTTGPREIEMAQQRSSNTETKEDLVKQIEQLRPDVSEIAKTLGELTKGEAAELRSQKKPSRGRYHQRDS